MTREEKAFRRFLKKWNNQRPAREVLPLMDEERYGNCSEDGENYTEYGFLAEKYSKFTDDEVNEFLNEFMKLEIRSPYDCTGQRFTLWIDWHRNPCGLISYQHRIGIDV